MSFRSLFAISAGALLSAAMPVSARIIAGQAMARHCAAGLHQMVGVDAQIEKVSQLRPGFHQIITKKTNSSSRVACTVSDKGTIEDCIQMNKPPIFVCDV